MRPGSGGSLKDIAAVRESVTETAGTIFHHCSIKQK